MTAEPTSEIPKRWAKDVRKIAEVAQRQGWRFDTTSRGHPRFWPADRTLLPETFSGTPGDRRAIHNFIAALRRKGLKWQDERKKKPMR